MDNSSKNYKRHSYCPGISLIKYTVGEPKHNASHLHSYDHCNTIHNSKNLEITHVAQELLGRYRNCGVSIQWSTMRMLEKMKS